MWLQRHLSTRLLASSRLWHSLRYSSTSADTSAWRQMAAIDEWVQRDARPVSLRQLTVFGRTLTKGRLLESANYVRTELPTRIAHRLRDIQTLPYVVITNPNMAHVYELYLKAFDKLRRVPEIKTLDDNAAYCAALDGHLQEHLSVIPKLVIGFLECQHLLHAEATDKLMSTLLKSRISRRVIAEQHLALTHAFVSQTASTTTSDDLIGEVFLNCQAKDIVDRCIKAIEGLSREAYGTGVQLPEVLIKGHLSTTLTYIPAHLEYVVGELLRNSFQALIEGQRSPIETPPPIEVLICEAPQHVIFRISDRGGGVQRSILPHLWSFVKGPRKDAKLENLNKVPQLSATLQELKVDPAKGRTGQSSDGASLGSHDTSLSTLSGRPPGLRLGIGLPMSRVYAEYWAGSLELHSLEGFGVDAFLQVSKLGNKNEQLSTRAAMDAL